MRGLGESPDDILLLVLATKPQHQLPLYPSTTPRRLEPPMPPPASDDYKPDCPFCAIVAANPPSRVPLEASWPSSAKTPSPTYVHLQSSAQFSPCMRIIDTAHPDPTPQPPLQNLNGRTRMLYYQPSISSPSSITRPYREVMCWWL